MSELWEQYQDQLDALHEASLNFDLEKRHEYTEANGWHLDEYQAELPPEPPGPPIPNGSWENAKQIMLEYKFPDPDIITGIYYPDRPLADRVMLLRAKFLFFTFYFGVRVGNVTDETRETDEGRARVWGFNYQTLEGHFERGQMDFEIWKWLDTGKVAFHIHAFSQPGQIDNPIYRLGFKMFGRKVQKRFAHRAMERMQKFVREALHADAHQQPEPATREDSPEVAPASASRETAAEMDEVEEQAEA